MKLTTLRNEFRWQNFRLAHDNVSAFSVSRWQETTRVSGWFVLYRLILAALAFGVLVGVIVESSLEGELDFWFIYYTDLGYFGLTIHMFVSAASVIERLLNQRDGAKQAQLTFLERFSWLTYNVITMNALVITIIYWAALYKPGSTPSASNLMVHVFNGVIVLLDLFVAAKPYRLLHFYQPMAPLIIYVIFSVIYWAAGGTDSNGNPYIYPILDWNNLGFTIPFVVVGFVCIFPFQAILWGLHLLRDYIYQRNYANRKRNGASNEAHDNDGMDTSHENIEMT